MSNTVYDLIKHEKFSYCTALKKLKRGILLSSFILIVYVWVLCLHVYLCTEPEEGIGDSGTGV